MEEINSLRNDLRSYIDPEKAILLPRYFKCGKGGYGEGDKFLGVIVPNVRRVARNYRNLPISELSKLIKSPWHEERQCALFILAYQFKRGDEDKQKQIYDFYLKNTKYINNWDLVDLSARDITGGYIYKHQELIPTLDKMAESDWLWDRRIAVISTFQFINHGDPTLTLKIVKKLLTDKHDLMQKANGWALREMGKRNDQQLLVDFLRDNYDQIPRTTLRYAIEHFSLNVRQRYLSGIFT
jgi:3-methyladenine DNA glycosylase AlkD